MDKRYTPRQKRLIEMEYLREHDRLTLQEIGDRFGLSRERVRQIIGNTGDLKLADKVREDADLLRDEAYFNESITVDEIAAKYRISKQYVARILGPRWKYLLGLGLRRCYRCHLIKPIDQFGVAYKRYKHFNVSGICKECNNAGAKHYYKIRRSKQARAAK